MTAAIPTPLPSFMLSIPSVPSIPSMSSIPSISKKRIPNA
jgi:hypothetical protein